MHVRINGTEYHLNDTFWALINYRREFGCSFFDEQDGMLALIRLTWAAISGGQPRYSKFEREALGDDNILATLREVARRILTAKNKDEKKGSEAKSDEMALLASWCNAGLPLELLKEFNAQMIVDMLEIMGKGAAPKGALPMTEAARKELYGITPEKERQIDAYLERITENGG